MVGHTVNEGQGIILEAQPQSSPPRCRWMTVDPHHHTPLMASTMAPFYEPALHLLDGTRHVASAGRGVAYEETIKVALQVAN